jgi:hypothetical protein
VTKVVSPHLKSLIFDALLASFWRKPALQRFIRGCGVSGQFAATLGSGETKRSFLERLFSELEGNPKESAFLIKLANALAEQNAFPDLHGWEDTDAKLQAAQRSVRVLREHLRAAGVDCDTETRRARSLERERSLLETQHLARKRFDDLKSRLADLATRLGSQKAGYEFQNWFYDLMALHEVTCRRPYVVDGRQLDGTVTIEGTTYIVELKFTQEQAGAPDTDSLAQKVSRKADNTMGIMVSMSGYSTTAKSDASGPGTKLLLLDYGHVNLALEGYDFLEMVSRIRRHASQTGRAYLEPANLS